MKSDNHLLFSLFCAAISLMMMISCEKTQIPRIISSTVPTKAQLHNSSFIKFIDKLQSASLNDRKFIMDEFISLNPYSPIIEGNDLTCFYWYGESSSLLINGDIQSAWQLPDTMKLIPAGENNFFYKIYTLPYDTRIDYLYIINGKEILDPRNPSTTPSGYGLHSQCAMPGFVPDSTMKINPSTPKGTLDTIFFSSKKTSLTSRRVIIYQPYSSEKNQDSLTTLYVNNGFEAIEYCSFISILDNLIHFKKISPLAAVFIEYIGGDEIFYLNNTEEYITAICDELIPIIEKNYSVSNTPNTRVISGFSASAHIALFTALKRPDKFLKAAGQSTTTTEKLFEAINVLPVKSRDHFKLYLDVGRFDLLTGAPDNQPFLYSSQLLHKKLEDAGINHEFRILNDGHQWANWRERTDDILLYFFGNGE